MTKFLKVLLVVVLLAGCSKKEDNNENELIIYTKNGEVRYSVENAVTPEQMEQGLMHRDSMPENHGMIFDLKGSGFVAMWMKNTKIPLDFVFIDENGIVAWIYENAVPYSEENIVPPLPIAAVLELNAGQVKKQGIEVDNSVRHIFFGDKVSKSQTEAATVVEAEDEVVFEDAIVEAPVETDFVDEVGADGTPTTGETMDLMPQDASVENNVNAVEPDTGVIIIDEGVAESEAL